jgi:hypothetical protein
MISFLKNILVGYSLKHKFLVCSLNAIVLLSLHKPTFAYERAKVIDLDTEFQYNKSWFKASKSDEENLKLLVGVIEQSTTGKKILAKAKQKAAEKGETLYDILKIGEGSLTDTTLIRRFQASDPTKVMYETKSRVYVNKYLNLLDASLDLAHELTHYTFREAFNPYVPQFSMREFIAGTVEGKGGEVDAFLIECKVYLEIFPNKNDSRSSCLKIKDPVTGLLSRERGIEEFYRVGKHFDEFQKNIEKYKMQKSDFPKISNVEAQFISSAWGVPYPLAAYREYVNIMDRVCKNDSNRLALLQQKLNRAPASADSDSKLQVPDEVKTISSMYQSMNEDYKGRCQNFFP